MTSIFIWWIPFPPLSVKHIIFPLLIRSFPCHVTGRSDNTSSQSTTDQLFFYPDAKRMNHLRKTAQIARVRSAPTQRSQHHGNSSTQSKLCSATGTTDPQNSYGSLANFSLQTSIGQGQFSIVWRAVHRQTGRVVAMKRVKVEFGCRDCLALFVCRVVIGG